MTNRADYIHNIGLSCDPFATPVAEIELKRLKETFYSLYIGLSTGDTAQEESYLERLRAPQHAFVFGQPGSGKTMLRLTLDADCRTVLDQTLTISYVLGEDIEKPLTLEEHGQRISKAFAIDLTLNILERFNPLNPFPSEAKIRALKRQVHLAHREFTRIFSIILEQPDEQLDPIWGLSKLWSQIGKAPVKYVSNSQSLKTLLNQLRSNPRIDISPGWEAFGDGLRTAREWGLTKFLLLIDGVDTKQRSTEQMMTLISPLLHKRIEMESEGIYFKFFLPKELETSLQQYLQSTDKSLHSVAFFSIIGWDEAGLKNLLKQRFRVAASRSGPRYMGLNDLAVSKLNLDEKVIHAAQGSPRRLLQIVDMLIDEHVKRAPESAKFDLQDWENCEKRLVANPLF